MPFLVSPCLVSNTHTVSSKDIKSLRVGRLAKVPNRTRSLELPPRTPRDLGRLLSLYLSLSESEQDVNEQIAVTDLLLAFFACSLAIHTDELDNGDRADSDPKPRVFDWNLSAESLAKQIIEFAPWISPTWTCRIGKVDHGSKRFIMLEDQWLLTDVVTAVLGEMPEQELIRIIGTILECGGGSSNGVEAGLVPTAGGAMPNMAMMARRGTDRPGSWVVNWDAFWQPILAVPAKPISVERAPRSHVDEAATLCGGQAV